jgi:predicted membrane protein
MAAAALVIANALYDFMGFWSIICLVIAVPIAIEFLIQRFFAGVFIPLAVLGIIFAVPLGIEQLTPWPLLAAAILLTIGFSVMFRKKMSISHIGGVDFDNFIHNNTESIVEDEFSCSVKFGSSTKYFVSDNLEKAYLSCEFGGLKAYFDEATLSPIGATLLVEARFGGVELYIPKHWKVQNSITASLGGVNESGRSSPNPDSPVFTINGTVSFGAVEIRYI